MAGPLHDLTVIELAGIGPAPFACMVLADMGARVVRIDRPPATGGAEMFRHDSVVNRGRRSVAVDLKSPQGVEAVLRLVERADVLVEGFRPGVIEKLGLGPDVLLARRPSLVVGRMTGWGQHGPLAPTAGHDLDYIAISGALHAMGAPDRPPPVPLNLVGDYGGGGMLLVAGVLAALLEVRRSGRGQVVDAAMSDGAALLMAPIYGLMNHGAWRDERGANLLDGAAPFYGSYACADGRCLAVGPLEPQFWAEFVRRLGLEGEEGFDERSRHDRRRWPALRERIAARLRERTRDDWCARFEGSDACVAPVLSMREAPAHPHNAARGTFVPTPDGGTQPAPAPRFAATPGELPPPGREIGADTEAVLREAGVPEAELRGWRAAGAVWQRGAG